MPKKRSKQKTADLQKINKEKEWPAVVYLWAFGLGFLIFVVIEATFRDVWPHYYHWLAGLTAGLLGIPIGWLWYRWRGDVF